MTVWRKIILLIPLIFLLPHIVPNPTIGVFLAEPIADFVAVCTTGTLFCRYYRRKLADSSANDGAERTGKEER